MIGEAEIEHETFTAEVDPEFLSAFRSIAHQEGRPIQALVDEALAEPVGKHRRGRPRSDVPIAQTSHQA